MEVLKSVEMSLISNLKPFFEPEGIAVVGARSSPGFGYGISLRLKDDGWGDCTYQVNPRGGELHGMPVYKNVAEVPDPVDLAVVIVPAPAVPKVIAEIGEKGIKHVIVQSAGFAETGSEGKRLQAAIKDVAERDGIRIIGPNCVGVLNTANRFSTTEIMPEVYTPGRLSVIAQSGVFGHNLLDMFNRAGLYIAKAATLGNRMDVNESELLDYLCRDPATDVITMYLEGAADGRLLVRTLERVNRHKPVIVLKSGRTPVGRKATASHTGSLSGMDALYESVFAQTGTVRALTVPELVAYTRVFASQPLPRGNRLGILTGSGSMGALAADTALDNGLVVPPLSRETADMARDGAPRWMNVNNPLDVGPSGQFLKAFNALMQDPGIDMVLAVVSVPYAAVSHFQGDDSIGNLFFGDIQSLRKEPLPKPFLISVVSHGDLVDIFKKEIEPEIPVFSSPEMPVKALAALWRLQNWRQRAC